MHARISAQGWIFFLFFNVRAQKPVALLSTLCELGDDPALCFRDVGCGRNKKTGTVSDFFTVCIFLPKGPEGHLIDLLSKPPRCVMNNVEL